MSGAPVGTVVGIGPFDMHGDEPIPEEGVFLLSSGGTAYEIVKSRLMTKSRKPNCYALRCRKLGAGYVFPEGASVIEFSFNRRDRRRPRR